MQTEYIAPQDWNEDIPFSMFYDWLNLFEMELTEDKSSTSQSVSENYFQNDAQAWNFPGTPSNQTSLKHFWECFCQDYFVEQNIE